MVEKRQPISVGEAVNRVLERVTFLASEDIHLEDSYGRILRQPLVATHAVPPFDRSPYDGFAIRSVDTTGASGDHRVQFKLVDHIGAGTVSEKVLGKHEAVRIMTGAPLPDGADAVVMLEQTVEDGDTFTIRKSFDRDENVSLQGEDVKEGEQVLEPGTFIHPGTVALLATFGHASVEVGKLPSVGILVTGSELVDVSEPLAPGKIRNSNGPMIAAQLKRMGVPYHMYRFTVDDLERNKVEVREALDEHDVLITTGGVSVGDFDFMPAIYEELEAEVLFNKVAMRPGSVTTVAYVKGKLMFGLSGNPSACFTGFELFVRPALRKMQGAKTLYLPHTKAVLGEDFSKANPFTRFIRASYDGHKVRPAGFNKSNAVAAIARGNALIVLPGGSRGYEAGMEVDVLILGQEDGVAEWTL